jgi:hypothetical protein
MWLNALWPRGGAVKFCGGRPPEEERRSSSMIGVITSVGPQTRESAISTEVPAVLRVFMKTKPCSWETITVER